MRSIMLCMTLSSQPLKAKLDELISDTATLQYGYPFEQLANKQSLISDLYQPLLHAIPDLEKRTYISMGGEANGQQVG